MTIEELKDLALKVASYTGGNDVISFGYNSLVSVHMTTSGFRKLFTEYEVKDRDDDMWPYELRTEVDGVTFFCLAKEK